MLISGIPPALSSNSSLANLGSLESVSSTARMYSSEPYTSATACSSHSTSYQCLLTTSSSSATASTCLTSGYPIQTSNKTLSSSCCSASPTMQVSRPQYLLDGYKLSLHLYPSDEAIIDSPNKLLLTSNKLKVEQLSAWQISITPSGNTPQLAIIDSCSNCRFIPVHLDDYGTLYTKEGLAHVVLGRIKRSKVSSRSLPYRACNKFESTNNNNNNAAATRDNNLESSAATTLTSSRVGSSESGESKRSNNDNNSDVNNNNNESCHQYRAASNEQRSCSIGKDRHPGGAAAAEVAAAAAAAASSSIIGGGGGIMESSSSKQAAPPSHGGGGRCASGSSSSSSSIAGCKPAQECYYYCHQHRAGEEQEAGDRSGLILRGERKGKRVATTLDPGGGDQGPGRSGEEEEDLDLGGGGNCCCAQQQQQPLLLLERQDEQQQCNNRRQLQQHRLQVHSNNSNNKQKQSVVFLRCDDSIVRCKINSDEVIELHSGKVIAWTLGIRFHYKSICCFKMLVAVQGQPESGGTVWIHNPSRGGGRPGSSSFP